MTDAEIKEAVAGIEAVRHLDFWTAFSILCERFGDWERWWIIKYVFITECFPEWHSILEY